MQHIEIIEKFLANWKEEARKYYTALRAEYVVQMKAEYPVTEENLKNIPKNGWTFNEKRYTDEKIAEFLSKLTDGTLAGHLKRNLEVEVHNAKLNRWKDAHSKAEIAIVDRMYGADAQEYLDKLLTKEVDGKRKKLFATVEKKAGKIVDASQLSIGVDGGINGLVVGETKTVRVTTIYAGGYNIQCLHYRVLVK